jgi:hypothetical protein
MRFFLNKMVSVYDTHWGNLNKFAKFVKMVRVQRVKSNTVKSLIFAGILFRVFVILCLCNSLKFAFLEGL